MIVSPALNIERFLKDGIVVCPDCHHLLTVNGSDAITCDGCAARYPLIEGTPVLTHSESAFVAEGVSSRGNYFASSVSENQLKRKIRRSLPALAMEYTRNEVDKLVHRELRGKAARIREVKEGKEAKSVTQ